MNGVPEHFEDPVDRAEFRVASHRSDVELYRAHIVRHTFDAHAHAAYGIGTIESGVERFRCQGSEFLAPPHSLVLMNPDVLHTGRAETELGWRYQNIYLDPETLLALTGEREWWFAQTVVDSDRQGAQRLSCMLKALWQYRDEPLAFDGLLYQLVNAVRRHASVSVRPRGAAHRLSPVLDYLNAHLSEKVTLEQLASVVDLSPFHFLRQFQAQYHVTPHQMLMALRLRAAKRLLAVGVAPIEVAAQLGLSDQSHLTRTFLSRYGVTPARYQRQLGIPVAPRRSPRR